jgi:hypothetical protein
VNASADEVLDFYKQQLPALGWQYSPSDISTTTTQGRGLAWRNGKTAYRVTMEEQDNPFSQATGGQYITTFTVYLIANKPVR